MWCVNSTQCARKCMRSPHSICIRSAHRSPTGGRVDYAHAVGTLCTARHGTAGLKVKARVLTAGRPEHPVHSKGRRHAARTGTGVACHAGNHPTRLRLGSAQRRVALLCFARWCCADGMGWGGTGRDGTGRDGTGWEGMGWDRVGRLTHLRKPSAKGKGSSEPKRRNAVAPVQVWAHGRQSPCAIDRGSTLLWCAACIRICCTKACCR